MHCSTLSSETRTTAKQTMCLGVFVTHSDGSAFFIDILDDVVDLFTRVRLVLRNSKVIAIMRISCYEQ